MMITNKLIVWRRTDGGIEITYPCDRVQDGESEQNYLDRIAERFANSHPQHSNYTRLSDVTPVELPTDRDFRNAWSHEDGKGIHVHFDKAREITKCRLRQERKPLLEELDVRFIRAVEIGESTDSIVQEKQRLRDLPNLCDSAKSLDELRALSCK